MMMMMMVRQLPFFFLVNLTFFLLTSVSVAVDTLTLNQTLFDADGTTLRSSGDRFELGFFTPSGSSYRYLGIWFGNISVRTYVWVANRQRPLAVGSGRLSLTTNGTLLLTDDNSTTEFWSSGSSSVALSNPVAQLRDDGNFVIREAARNGYPVWQSYDVPTDTILPGMRFGRNITSGFNLNLTAWTSLSDPAPGGYMLGVDMEGVPEQLLWLGTQPVWRSGPWTGHYLSGVPLMGQENLVEYHYEPETPQQFVYSYTVRDSSFPARITLNSSGRIEVLVWVEDDHRWSVLGYVPIDPCDSMAACGPNAICLPNSSPMCVCLTGFQPKNPTNWDLIRSWSDGCVRKTDLDCLNTTDGFFNQSSVKMPDTSAAVMDTSLTLEQCRSLCLNDCNCTAYASANITGSGCIRWSSQLTDIKFFFGSDIGQDLFVRLAAADLIEAYSESNPPRQRRVGLIVAVTLAAAFLLSIAALCIWKWKSKKRCVAGSTKEDLNLPLFDLGTIVNATGNFSIDNKLGEGGFGPVYKGRLEEGQEIAVKRLSKASAQGLNEFKNEVQLIAKLQHRNLVPLVGGCIEAGERMLIYEFLPNGSLDKLLFDKAKSGRLGWKLRYNIIVGIARGLLYLHHESRFRIIHRDMKASNVLLDKDMNPKISDFGMARIVDGDEMVEKTKIVVGTYGYMSPEYIKNGTFSIKSDIFSFGVLILEIVSGKRNTEVFPSAQHLNLLDYVWRLWRNDEALESIDETISNSFSMEEVMKCINIGLLCVQERPSDRPTIASILLMLGSDNVLLPEPSQPGFVCSRNIEEDKLSSTMQYSSSNQVSVTIAEGR